MNDNNPWEPAPAATLSKKVRALPPAMQRIRRRIPQASFTKAGAGTKEMARDYLRWALTRGERAIASAMGWIPEEWVR